MSMNLPPPIASFFQAFNGKDTDAFLASFASDALVTDEEREYCGAPAIEGWFAAVNAKYQPILEATNLGDVGDTIVVATQVSGTFPGSPIQLHYHFKLQNGKIAALSIGN
ncbi:MAG: nuclear transport factor 2 family protein [Verrucomicrobiae bacterium]|nr:nuclear transport factor 2 family protein [Verrucomicrobiae bacterium]